MIEIISAKKCHQGRKRKNNEDFTASFEPGDPVEQAASGSLYIVCDGVGGASFGERASRYAAEKVLYEYYQHTDMEVGTRLRQIIEQVNREIFSFADQSEHISRMGTTLVAVAIIGDQLIVANVGDSRAYLIRDGMVTQITNDHSLIGELVRNHSLTEEEALTSKAKNKLTRALGSEEEVHVDIFPPIQILQADKLLLCTDGLTRYALQEDVARLTQEGTPEEITTRLVNYANQRGGADNISVIVISAGTALSQQKTMKIQKGPTPVSWDNMETQPWVQPARRKRRPAPAVWMVTGLVALVFVGAAAIGVGKLIIGSAAPTATTTAVSAASPSPAGLELVPSEEALEPTAPPVSTDTVSPVETVTAVFTTTPWVGKCQYTVRSGDSISIIFKNLGKEQPPAGQPFPGVTCAPLPGNAGCNLTNQSLIQPGWILIIENVNSEICSNQYNRGTAIP